ncbi:MAG: signal peptidase II [Bradyrhizobiaceae bacterium PARB1]|uniref:signal peptidase II n=1 Tax=Tardiphaga sp. TaxID=1926292 RepID=UPI000BC676CF|nr:MAG: signal peptidase II [Bradyrhizobiaceae bacterium PARB1]
MKWIFPFIVAATSFWLDASSKAWAQRSLAETTRELLSFLSLRLGFNSGIAFSWFASDEGANRYVILVATSLLSLAIVCVMATARIPTERVALALILGGALGNIADRIPDGYVTDFISVRLGEYHFPIFNLADVCITIGAMLLFLALAPLRCVRHDG